MNRLRREYESLTDEASGRFDPDALIATAARRRVRRRVAVTAAATSAAVVAIAVGAATFDWPRDATPAADRVPDGEDLEASFQVSDWVPNPLTPGEPPATGTIIYRTCSVDECVVYLRRPDGVDYPLAGINPRASEQIESNGFDGAALSNDALELGVRTGAGYELYRLGDDEPIYKADSGPAGSHWQVGSWGVGTAGLCLVQTQNELPVAFTKFWDGEPNTYEADGLELLPLGGSCGSLADPIDVSIPSMNRERVTELRVDGDIVIAEAEGLGEPGAIHSAGKGKDFSDLLRENETLAGERGVAETLWQPGAMDSAIDDLAREGIKVFLPTQDGLTTSAVLLSGYPGSSSYVRIDLPESEPGDLWEPLGLTTDGVAVSHTITESGVKQLAILPLAGDEPSIIHELPVDAEILIPGGIIE